MDTPYKFDKSTYFFSNVNRTNAYLIRIIQYILDEIRIQIVPSVDRP